MGQVINGEWVSDDSYQYCGNNTHYIRQEILDSASLTEEELDTDDLVVSPGRYVLYSSLASPMGHACVIFRTLKRLERVIGLCLVYSVKKQHGWEFHRTDVGTNDKYNSFTYLHEIYTASEGEYSGGATVPVLWDTRTKKIVSNDPEHILRILNSKFNHLTEQEHDYYPEEYREQIDRFNHIISEDLYQAIYQCAFADKQDFYESCIERIFSALEELDALLEHRQVLLGSRICESDWRLFVLLIRFDAVFYPLFKVNKKRIEDYKYLHDYVGYLYQEKYIGCTVNIEHIKQHYYMSYRQLNPNGIIPVGPDVHFDYLYSRFSLF